jgi:hypothetical protein
VTITVAGSNSPGTPAAGVLQVTSLDIQNMNPAQAALVIAVSDTNYTLPGMPGDNMLLQSAVGGTFTLSALNDAMTFQSFVDPANAQPATALNTPALLFFKTNPLLGTEPFNGGNSIPWMRGAGPYSLTNITTVVLSNSAQMNMSGTTIAIPEPAVASLGMLGLSAMMALRRRRN